MHDDMSLKELMNPTRLERQARFNNAQIAVDLGYRIAEKFSYVPDTKVLSPEWKEGDSSHSKYDYLDATPDVKTAALVKMARELKLEIEKDLNETIKVLDEVKDGDKAKSA